jgi:anthraniloyl-CoA monooxygenase
MVQDAARDGVVGDWHLVHYGARAVGGAGLLLTEMTAVTAEARLSNGGAGLWNDEQVAAWRRICDFVHEQGSSGNAGRAGTAKIGVQLGHAGRRAFTPSTLAASALPWSDDRAVPTALDREAMDRVREAFVAATHRARTAGFDLVELQLGHGHLLADFLSPLTNRRADEYGGAIGQRLAFPVEIVAAVRATWPADRPLAARISASDWQEGGLTLEEAVEIARALAEHGCDIIDVSSGETTPRSTPPYGRLYQVSLAEHLRLVARVPTMTSGGISTAGDLNAVLAGGRADLCLVGHQHLWDPHFTHHAEAKEGREPAWPRPYDALRRYRPRT